MAILNRVLGDKATPFAQEQIVSRFEIIPPDGVRVHTGLGDYTFKLGDAEKTYGQGLPNLQIVDGRIITSEILIYPEDSARTEAIIRSVFRADPYVHPYLQAVDDQGRPLHEIHPSAPQREALDFLRNLEDGKHPQGIKAALVMPTGLGKTITAALHVKELSQRLNEDVNVIFTVQNEQILSKTVSTFARVLGIPEEKRVGLFGQDTQTSIPDDVRMVAVTRSTYLNRKDRIHELVQNGKPWVVFIDEGHHAESSEYAEIREDLERYMSPKFELILMTATLWRSDAVHLVRDLLQGNVYGALLNPEEHSRLRNGSAVDIQELSRLQFKRAIAEGYLTALHRLNIVQHIQGGQEVGSALPRTVQAEGQSLTMIPPELITDLKQRVAASERSPLKGLVFVENIAIANKMVELWGEGAYTYHSQQSRTLNQRSLNTFSQRGGLLFVIDAFNEGVDIPDINLLVFLRGTDSFRILLQNIGRGSRNAALKPDLSVIDYSGSTRFLVDDLPEIMMARRSGSSPESVDARSGVVIVDDRLLTLGEFRIHRRALFPEDDFLVSYPHYDSGFFSSESGALLVLRVLGGPQNGFLSATKTEFFELQIIQKLPRELQAKARDQAAILREREGGVATLSSKDQETAKRQIYSVMVNICRLWNEVHSNPEQRVNIETVHTGVGMRAALQTMGLLYVVGELDMQEFDGGLGVLKNLGGRSNGFLNETKTKFFEQKIIQKLPRELQAKARDRVLILQNKDGSGTTSMFNEEPRRRIYKAFVGICEIWNETHPSPEQRVSIETVHTRVGMRAALQTMGLLSVLDEVDMQEFYAGLKVLSRLTRFGRDIDSQFFEQKIIQKLPRELQAKARDRVAILQDNDGYWAQASYARDNEEPRRRIYKAFVGICEIWNETHSSPEQRVNIETVHTEIGMRTALQGMGLRPVWENVDMDIFAQEGLQQLRSLGGEGDGFLHSTRTQFFENLIILRLPTELQAKARDRITGLKNDVGSSAIGLSTSSKQFIYEAFVSVCEVWNEAHPSPEQRVNIETVHTRVGMRTALQVMGLLPP